MESREDNNADGFAEIQYIQSNTVSQVENGEQECVICLVSKSLPFDKLFSEHFDTII